MGNGEKIRKKTFSLDQETFRLLTKNSFDIITVLAEDGTIIYESEAAEKLLGHHHEERIGENVFTYVHPDDMEMAVEKFSLLKNGSVKGVFRVQHKNGNWLWLESIGQRFNSELVKNGVIINSRDITDRVIAEQELQKREERYRNLIDHSADILYRLSNKNGGQFYSSVVKDILGFDSDEIVADPFLWNKLIHPDDRERVKNAIDNYFRGADFNIEYRIQSKQGNWIWLHDYFMHKYEEDDEIIIEGHAADITKRKEIEEKLRKSEDRLSKVMLASNDGLWDWNLSTNEVYFDPQYYKMAGYDIDDFPYRLEEFQKRIHPWDVDSVMNEAQKHIEGKVDRFVVEFRFKEKSGRWLWILGRGVIVERDEYGKPLRFVGTHTDINQRKEAEIALKESEQKFKALVSNTADGLLILHPENGVEYVSPSYLKILGYTEKEELGRSIDDIAELIHPDEREIVFQNIFKAVDNKEELLSYVFRARHKSGKYIWRRDKATFEYNENGEYQKAYVVCSDITNEVNQKRLIDQRKDYLVALNQGSVIFQEGKFIDQLQEFIEIIGEVSNASRTYVFRNHTSKNGNLLMSQIAEYVAAGIKPEIDNSELQNLSYSNWFPRWLNVLKNNEIISGVVADFPESERKILEPQDIKAILIIPILIDNEFWGFIGFDNCVEEKEWQYVDFEYLKASAEKISNKIKEDQKKKILEKQNQELEHAVATKDRFISILSHDLRAPFNSILGLCELLIENIYEYDKEKIKKFVVAIQNTSNDTFILLSNLLEWSRVQRNKLTFNPIEIDLQRIIDGTYKIMKQAALDKKIDVQITVKEPVLFEADKAMLNTIIRNLLNNAIKFTPDNGKIIISAKRLNQNVELIISDSGIGMDDGTIQSLFKLGETCSQSGTKGEKGTGFGLLLCKEFVDKHNGSICVKSEPGKGSTFSITLPQKQQTLNKPKSST